MSSTATDQEKGEAEHELLEAKTESPRSSLDLPSPVTSTSTHQQPQQKSTPTAARYKLSATTIIPIWIVLSSTVIIYNNFLYNTLNFKYPVFLVTFHLGFAAIGTRVLQRTTNLLDGLKDVNITKEIFVRSILPIGLLFSGSLILSNSAYLYLSVAYIQMLKVRFSAKFTVEKHLSDIRLPGFHARSNFAHLMDVPYPGPKQKAGHDCFHDLFWGCSGVSRRNEVQPDRIPLPSCGCRSEYHLPSFLSNVNVLCSLRRPA